MPGGARPIPPAVRRGPSVRPVIHQDSFENRPLFLPFPFYWAPAAIASATARLPFWLMSSSIKTFWTETLPEPLPANPLELAAQWLGQARVDAALPHPNFMVLATVDARGNPSARVVLCKEIRARPGCIVFYTNYRSRKGLELAGNPRAAVVFHWDHRHRQVRAEGRVEVLADAENDAYFRTRPWQSRLGAWASAQSEPVESRQALERSVAEAARRFGIPYEGPG